MHAQVLAEVNATQQLGVARHVMLSLVLHKIVDTSQVPPPPPLLLLLLLLLLLHDPMCHLCTLAASYSCALQAFSPPETGIQHADVTPATWLTALPWHSVMLLHCHDCALTCPSHCKHLVLAVALL